MMIKKKLCHSLHAGFMELITLISHNYDEGIDMPCNKTILNYFI